MTPIKTILQRTFACLLLLSSSLVWADDGFSDAKLQQLLAPIALYPDTVLTHVLIAATYPLEIVQADRWAKQHPQLSGQEALNRAENETWDPSIKALLAFPTLLAKLSEDLFWTQELGEAFLANEEQTLNAVQTLRQQAWENGSLQDMEHQTVERIEKQIVIQPTRREVVYIPYYDTRAVYGSWRWSAYPPVYWSHPPHYRSGFYWGASAPVGDWFYFSGFYWPNRTVVVNINRPYYYGSHARYGYHQDYTHHWRHDHSHRRNVRYRQRSHRVHGPHSQQRDQIISERQRKETVQQLRHHPSRIRAHDNKGAHSSATHRSRASNNAIHGAQQRVKSSESQRQPVHRGTNNRAERSAAPANERAATRTRVQPRHRTQESQATQTMPSAVKRSPNRSEYGGSPRTLERRTAPRSNVDRTRARSHRQTPARGGASPSNSHRSRVRRE